MFLAEDRCLPISSIVLIAALPSHAREAQEQRPGARDLRTMADSKSELSLLLHMGLPGLLAPATLSLNPEQLGEASLSYLRQLENTLFLSRSS